MLNKWWIFWHDVWDARALHNQIIAKHFGRLQKQQSLVICRVRKCQAFYAFLGAHFQGFRKTVCSFVLTNHVASHRISCIGHWVGDWWLCVWLKCSPQGLPVSEWNDMRCDWLAVLKDRWRARVSETQTLPDLTSLLMSRIADSMYGRRDTRELHITVQKCHCNA